MEWRVILKNAAEAARKEVLRIYGSSEAVEASGVGYGGDLIRKIDLAAENAIIRVLDGYGVACTLISEESGIKTIGGGSDLYLVVDAVDGTENALHGLPLFATSLALSDGPNLSDVKMGLVLDLYHNIAFSAERSKGASLNWKTPINPSSTTDLEKALIGIDLGAPKNELMIKRLFNILTKTRRFRQLGAVALEICYVAAGSLDAFIDIRNRMRVVDVAAAFLILKESGGLLFTPEGSIPDIELKSKERLSLIAAGNIRIAENILKSLA